MTCDRFSGIRTFFLLLTCLISAKLSFSQDYRITGKVTDAQNRQPLAFVNIVVNDGLTGGMSDIDGRYDITCNKPITSIRFSYLGYQTYETSLKMGAQPLNVALTPTQFELNEVVVNAGENPAHRIIDSVMAHRAENNPDHLNSYSYSIYDKMVITIDSTSLGKIDASDDQTNLKSFSSILENNDLMVMETYSDVFFMSPDKKKQNVKGNKISGMKDPTFIYLASAFQSVSFYEETVSIAGTDYLNPLSKGSKKKYFFNIESVSPIGNGDSLYIISFHPYKNLDFNSLNGSLCINSDGWAVQSVKVSPTKEGEIYHISIQQLYAKTEGQWFPRQFNTILGFPSIGVQSEDGEFLQMAAIGKSYITDIQINPELDRKLFSEVAIEVDPHAAYRNDDYWLAHRIDSLNERTLATYRFIDSITEGLPVFDVTLGMTTEIMETGMLPIGKISLDLNRLVNYSMSRGYYFGLDLSTNRKLSRRVGFNLTGGYWTRLKEFDYGGSINFNLYPRKQTELKLSAFNRSEVIAAFNDFQDGYKLLEQSDFKYAYYENIASRKRGFDLQLNSRIGRYLKAFFTAEMSDRRYLETYYTDSTDGIDKAHFITTQLRLRYAYNEKFIGTADGLRSLGTTYPILWFSYQHSFSGLWDCNYAYDKLKLQVEKHFYTRTLGVSSVLLQAGYATQSAPVVETFDLIGSNSTLYLYAPTSFSTMLLDEFFCDRFVALYLSHNFGGTLWQPQTKWSKPELTLVTNLGWGDMRRIKDPTLCNFKTMEKGYFESGIVIEGLINMSIMKLGGGLFYRYGPYAFDRTWDNLVWKWSVKFSL